MAETESAPGETAPEGAVEDADQRASDDETRPLEVYEWGGAIAAGLGFFMTPLVVGLPAIYCALKIQEEKPLASAAILALLIGTVLFWVGFVFGDNLVGLLVGDVGATPGALALFVSIIFVIPLAIFIVVLILRR